MAFACLTLLGPAEVRHNVRQAFAWVFITLFVYKYIDRWSEVFIDRVTIKLPNIMRCLEI